MNKPKIVRASCVVLLAAVLVACAQPVLAISSRSLITPDGEAASDEFGYCVSGAGDVNGDGFGDMIVGAHLNDAGGAAAGQSYVYFGGPGTDAISDLTLTGAAAGDQFGISVAAAGDVNGDGFGDVIVGAHFNDLGGTDAGGAYVYAGGPGADTFPDLSLIGTAGDQFGRSVSGAGDVNGDGYADVIVGAPLYASTDVGRACVYYCGPGADTLPDLAFTGAAAGDQFGNSVAGAGDVNGDGFGDVIVGASLNDGGGTDAGGAYVYYGGPEADSIADLTLTGAAGDHFGASVAGAGDVNGDGFGDVIVGGPLNSSTDNGRAYVYYGGPDANSIADLTLIGETGGDVFGTSVSSAGDVNGDGFADVAVGAPGNDAGGTGTGRAYLYYGGLGADSIADLTLTGAGVGDQFGYPVAGAGDLNGDSFGDVVVGARFNDTGGTNAGRVYAMAIYPYEVLTPNGGETWVAGTPVTVRWLGHDVADLALSIDGGFTWSTLVAGVGGQAENAFETTAPWTPTPGAKVRLSYSGESVAHSTSDVSDVVFRIVIAETPPAAAHRLQLAPIGEDALSQFGCSVAGAGDVNGDGFADVIVGASARGRAYVYHGGPGADAVVDLTLIGEAAGDQFGISVAGAGDVNGDGFGDMIVGAWTNDAAGTDAGRAYVYYGGLVGNPTADLTLTGAAEGDLFGISVAGAGDVNGDGFGDVIVGAPLDDAGGTDAGRAYVYHGGPGADPVADLTLTGEAADDGLGTSVAGAGDVNGDSFEDVIVGAPGGLRGEWVYVYFAGPGADATPDLILDGNGSYGQGTSYFGASVSGAGDVNGDGFADVIVGEPGGGINFTGAAYVYYGWSRPDAIADITLTGEAASDYFGSSVAGAGDVNGDGFGDVIVGAPDMNPFGGDPLRAYAYYGGVEGDAVADITLTGEAAGDRFGCSVAGAGDMNGDGFGDLIVGAYLNDPAGHLAGRAYVYDINRYHLLAPSGGETWNVGATQTVSWLGAEPADIGLSVDGGASFVPLETGAGGASSNTISFRVPHLPTRFARIQVTPSDATVSGRDRSDSLFTIHSTVLLLSLRVEPTEEGTLLRWATEPGVGPEGLRGYRLYRRARGEAGAGVRIGPELIVETSYTDPSDTPGNTYRLMAVNGFEEELLLSESVPLPRAPLAAWPLPYHGGELSIAFATASGAGGGPGAAEVGIYDLGGRLVRAVARGRYEADLRYATWDGCDDRGQAVASGVYFLRSRTGGEETNLKLVVVR